MSVDLISTDFVNNASRFSDKHRYLIDASSEERLKESFASVGNEIGIADADTQKTLSWFGSTKEEWVLLYDNADNRKSSFVRSSPIASTGTCSLQLEMPIIKP